MQEDLKRIKEELKRMQAAIKAKDDYHASHNAHLQAMM
jgi:hypothetical protein